MRIAHLSDLHFASWDWDILHFFSKRWLGNLNYLFGRRNHFDHARLEKIPVLLKSLDVSLVIVTGDLSTTSAPAELRMAKEFISKIEAQGLPVFCIPGNHDHYTRSAYKNRLFYDYFSSSWDIGNLKEMGVTAKKLILRPAEKVAFGLHQSPGIEIVEYGGSIAEIQPPSLTTQSRELSRQSKSGFSSRPEYSSDWWIVGLDTALATSWFHSTGYFTEHIEQALEGILQKIPTDDQIILVNHFPFFQHESPRKRLVRGLNLQKIIEKHPQIRLYFHGHTHRRCVAPLSSSGLPLILDPGSTPSRKNGGWNLIELSPHRALLEQYTWDQNEWTPSFSDQYDLV